ncbi:MAG: DMT family transporter [Campylobacter sp.]
MTHILALLAAGCCEVLGVFFLTKFQKSFGVKKASNFLILVANFALSLWLLSYAMQAMVMSVAYATWTGIGAVGAVGVGVIFNGEKMSVKKAFYLSLITLSAVILKII